MADFQKEWPWKWADLLGYDAGQNLQLVVELKPRVPQAGTLHMAGQWLREVGQERPELYALFITPEWVLLRNPAPHRQPRLRVLGTQRQAVQVQLADRLGADVDFAVNASECLGAAIDTQRMPLAKLVAGGLERVVASWLSAALQDLPAELLAQPAQGWLVDSGLHTALRHGTVMASSNPAAYAFAG